MQVDFYIDVYFFINLFMNSCLLFLVGKIRKQPIHKLRMIASAIIGALIACVSALMTEIPIMISLLFDYVATSMLMIFIAFGKTNKRTYIQTYITFLLCTFLLGGLLQSCSETFQAGNHLANFYEVIYKSKPTLLFLCVVSALLTPFLFYCYHVFIRNRKVLTQLYEVELHLWKDKVIVCKGFMDTGNALVDPILGWPVIIADYELLKEELVVVQKEKPTSFCVIPYTSVGKEQGLLYGIRMDSVTIVQEEERICTKNVVIALSEHGFRNKKEYRVLLHHDLLGF